MLTLPASRMAAFIFSRKWRKASRVCGVSLIRRSYLLDDDFAYHAAPLVNGAVIRHGSRGPERVDVEPAPGDVAAVQHGAGVGRDGVGKRRRVLPANLLARGDEDALGREPQAGVGRHDHIRTLAGARSAATAPAPVDRAGTARRGGHERGRTNESYELHRVAQ